MDNFICWLPEEYFLAKDCKGCKHILLLLLESSFCGRMLTEGSNTCMLVH